MIHLPPSNSTTIDQSEPEPDPASTHHDSHATSHHQSSGNYPSFQYNASLHPLETPTAQAPPTITTHQASLSKELRVQKETWGFVQDQKLATTKRASRPHTHQEELHSSGSTLPVRASSVKSSLSASTFSGGSRSPASTATSPGLGPLNNMTALPSPIEIGTSPGPWSNIPEMSDLSPPSSTRGPLREEPDSELTAFPRSSPKKRKAYPSLIPPVIIANLHDTPGSGAISTLANHSRNRSHSEYVPVSIQIPRGRNNVVSGSQTPTLTETHPPEQMQREEYLAIQRGILGLPSPEPPTPPRSNRSVTDEAGESEPASPPLSPTTPKGPLTTRYEARMIKSGKIKRWIAVRQLGNGTFSTVMLATSETRLEVLNRPIAEEDLDLKSLVAVKICEHGPAGGADEQKIESSLKRELDILKAINHPSLVHLKAVSILNTRAYLVLNYSPGGDLFELASLKHHLLIPALIRRIFAELVAAVAYLHSQYIVHRDIKLENVLVNLPLSALSQIPNWQTYPNPIITLTDLGLGRWIPPPPASPLLTTRCGSEDYAAPELLMGQEYDGRATDAWALGVLLYAIMEGRLPFDAIPGSKRKSPTSHRIARCEWGWVRWAGADGEWDSEAGKDLQGGCEAVEGLLRRARTRWGVEKLLELEWVRGGIEVEGGLRVEEEADGEGRL